MRRDSLLRTAVLAVTVALATPTPAVAQVPKRASPTKVDCTVLPIPEPKRPPITELDARRAGSVASR